MNAPTQKDKELELPKGAVLCGDHWPNMANYPIRVEYGIGGLHLAYEDDINGDPKSWHGYLHYEKIYDGDNDLYEWNNDNTRYHWTDGNGGCYSNRLSTLGMMSLEKQEEMFGKDWHFCESDGPLGKLIVYYVHSLIPGIPSVLIGE